MRMTGFVFGGIVGAVAATYLIRGGQMASRMSNVAMTGIGASVGKAMSGMMKGNKNMNAQNKSAQNNQAQCNQAQSNQAQNPSSYGLEKVSDLASKDSFVKAQVNDILCENNESAHMVR